MAYLDGKHSLPGLLALLLFLAAAHLAWPALMPVFLAAGFLLSAYKARAWVVGDAAAYRALSLPGPASLLDSLPFFLPLGFALALLILSEVWLRQAWINVQRGSVVAAFLVACFCTPVLLLGARAMGTPLVRRSLRPFLPRQDAVETDP